jgi:HEAT repeat protein
MNLQPRVTRSRSLKFIDGRLSHPRATSVLLYRLINEESDAQIREALVEAISHSKGEYADAMLDLITREPEPRVRARMVAALRHADESSVLRGLQLGFKDNSAVVRAATARTIGKLEKTPQLTNLLMTHLADKDPSVQIAAIQSARIYKLTEAKGDLETLLSSTHPSVRLESLYAIGQLAPEVLQRVPKLEQDPDQKVSEAAIRLRHKAGFRGPPRLK